MFFIFFFSPNLLQVATETGKMFEGIPDPKAVANAFEKIRKAAIEAGAYSNAIETEIADYLTPEMRKARDNAAARPSQAAASASQMVRIMDRL